MQLIGENIVISGKAADYLKNFVISGKYSSVFVLCDENTAVFCLPFLTGFEYRLIRISSGEINKRLATCEIIWQSLLSGSADRHSLLINLGGGVIGDMGGFSASVYMRGIDFIQVPTTLLAMVDASVGGKTGIDFLYHKNMLGLFSMPLMVFILPSFLDTLSQRQIMSGYAEMLKHGLIADADYWAELRTFNKRRLRLQIERSVLIKKAVAEEDPEESSYRKVLNFGHTLGHAIESFCMEKGRDVLHGEAVAAGMYLEAAISSKAGLTHEQIREIKATLSSLYAPVQLKSGEEKEIWHYVLRDKKNRADRVNCTLLSSIGRAVTDLPISFSEFEEAFGNYIAENSG
jgi:3-dehydroquinate synthase